MAAYSAAVAELSPTFGPTIQMSVLTAGKCGPEQPSPPTPELQDGGADLLRQRVPAEPGCGHPGHGGQHPAELQLHAAQSVLDSADPIKSDQTATVPRSR